VQRPTARSKAEIFRGFGVAEAPSGIQVGTPIELSISESTESIFTLIFAFL
jgi:hypothetical protein